MGGQQVGAVADARVAQRRYVEQLAWRQERLDAPPPSTSGLTQASTFRMQLELLKMLESLRDHLEHDLADTSGIPSHQDLLDELSADAMNAARRRLNRIDEVVEEAAQELIEHLEDEEFLEEFDNGRSVTQRQTLIIELTDRLTESVAGQEYVERSLADYTFAGELPLVHPDRLLALLEASPIVTDLQAGGQSLGFGVDPDRWGELSQGIGDAVQDPEWMARRAVAIHSAFTAQVVPVVAAGRLRHLEDAGDAVAQLTEAGLTRLYPASVFADADSTAAVIAAARDHDAAHPYHFPTSEIAANVGMLLDAADAFTALDRYARGPDDDRRLEDLASGVFKSLEAASKLMDHYGDLGEVGSRRLKKGTAWIGAAVFVLDVIGTRRELRTAQRTGDTAVQVGHALVLAGGATTALTTFAIAYGWIAATGPVGIGLLAAGTVLVLVGEIIKVTMGKHPFQQVARTCYYGLARAQDDRDQLPTLGDPDYGFLDADGNDHLPRQIDGLHSVLRPLGFGRSRQTEHVDWNVTLHRGLGPDAGIPDGYLVSAVLPQEARAHPLLMFPGATMPVEQLIDSGTVRTARSDYTNSWVELRVSLPPAGARSATLYDYVRE